MNSLLRYSPARKLVGVIALALSGCAGPPVLERQVLGYDEVAKTLDEKLLLLNIARVDNGESVHFTSTSSIAATFNWTTTVGAGGRLNDAPQTNFLDLNLGSSVSENPTFSIIPLSGADFSKRILTPFQDTVFEFLVFQGEWINQVMRLMGAGIEIQTPDGAFLGFIENDPRRPSEYEEFRRIAKHLQWLNSQRLLFVRSLIFEETLVANFQGTPSPEDIYNAFTNGFQWRQKPSGSYELTRLKAGRVMVSNFDPMALSDRERFEINEKIRRNPQGFVYLEIRPDEPGGEFPMQGAIKLRSLFQILGFLAKGIRTAPEFDVTSDPRTGDSAQSPAATLKINTTKDAPSEDTPSVEFENRYYTVNDTHWDRSTFSLLNILFQTAVGNVEAVGIPVTIAK